MLLSGGWLPTRGAPLFEALTFFFSPDEVAREFTRDAVPTELPEAPPPLELRRSFLEVRCEDLHDFRSFIDASMISGSAALLVLLNRPSRSNSCATEGCVDGGTLELMATDAALPSGSTCMLHQIIC